jgi:hypothetical protein
LSQEPGLGRLPNKQILKSPAIEDMYVERLDERLGITAPTVFFTLKSWQMPVQFHPIKASII